MPAKKSDWKRELGRLQTSGATGPAVNRIPHVILEGGTRSSVGNEDVLASENLDQMLEVMDKNLRHRGRRAKSEMEKRVEQAKKRNPKSITDRMKGLFGGG